VNDVKRRNLLEGGGAKALVLAGGSRHSQKRGEESDGGDEGRGKEKDPGDKSNIHNCAYDLRERRSYEKFFSSAPGGNLKAANMRKQKQRKLLKQGEIIGGRIWVKKKF